MQNKRHLCQSLGRVSLHLCNYSWNSGGVLLRNNLMRLSTSSLFLDFCFNVGKVENRASQTGVDIRIRDTKQLLGSPLAHLHVIYALFWKPYGFLEILCGLVHKVFNRTMQKPVFRWDLLVVFLVIVLKLAETVYTAHVFGHYDQNDLMCLVI